MPNGYGTACGNNQKQSKGCRQCVDLEDDPEAFSFWKIKHGIRWTGMPSWKQTLTDQQIWSLAFFLKHMDKLPPAPEQAWQNVVN